MLSKVLLVLVVLLLVGAVVWTWRRPARRDSGADRPRAIAMVACAHCGLLVPASEALLLDDRAYCCAGHRDSGPRAES